MKMNKIENFLLIFLSINFAVFSDDHLFMDQTSHKKSRSQLKKQYERCKKKFHADVPSGNNIENFDVSGLHRRSRFSSIFSVVDQSKSMNKVGQWSRGEVPVELEPSFTKAEKSSLKCAILYFRAHTCLTFLVINQTHDDYLYVMKTDKNGGCVTDTVGKKGGKQILNLDSADDHCWEHGTIIHELMHVLGFFHEQSRLDRDQYLVIHWNNIPKSLHFQYWTTAEMGYEDKDVGKYDYASVMHYGRYLGFDLAMSAKVQNDQYEEQANNNDAMGQRIEPSDQDTNKLNLMYCPHLVTQSDPNCKDELDCTDFATGCQISEFVRNKCKKTCGLCEENVRELSVTLTTQSTTVTHFSTKSDCEDCIGLDSPCQNSEVIREKCKRTCGLCDKSVRELSVTLTTQSTTVTHFSTKSDCEDCIGLDSPCQNSEVIREKCKRTCGLCDKSVRELSVTLTTQSTTVTHFSTKSDCEDCIGLDSPCQNSEVIREKCKRTCGLCDKSVRELSVTLTTQSTTVTHFSTKSDVCVLYDPCENNGTCTDRGNGLAYVCNCTTGWSGINCTQPGNDQSIKILLIGGVGNGKSSMEYYYPYKSEYNSLINVTMIKQRQQHTSVVMNDGKIMTMGGWSNGDRLNNVEIFDPFTNTITKGPNMNKARSDCGSAIINGIVYVCGGHDGENPLSSCESYQSGVWEYVTSMQKAHNPLKLISLNGYLYAIDGRNNQKNSVEKYNPNSNSWEEVKSMQIPRSGYGATVLNGFIYVCCGYKKHSCERYDPSLNKWSNITKTIINRVVALRMVSDGQHLFAIGGRYRDARRSVEMYDVKKDKWTMLSKPLIYQRHHSSVVVLY